jgi:CheY-like chemotaxis protein
MYKLGFLLEGFSVDVALDGEEGIQRVLRGNLPDVIVLDLGLPRVDQRTPRKDELEMLATIRSLRLTQSIPVVALSSDPDGFRDVIEQGATECIAKWRVTPGYLASEVRHLIQRSDDF